MSKPAARFAGIALFLVGTILASAPASAQKIDDLQTLSAYLESCLRRQPNGPPPSVARSVTVRYALRRDGSMIGEPTVSASTPVREAPGQAAFIAGRITALKACMPVPLSDGLGGAIAGSRRSMRFDFRPQTKEQSL